MSRGRFFRIAAGTFESVLGLKEGAIRFIRLFTPEKTWSLPSQGLCGMRSALQAAPPWVITAAAIHEDGIEPPTNPV